jgi:hypothetical protein
MLSGFPLLPASWAAAGRSSFTFFFYIVWLIMLVRGSSVGPGVMGARLWIVLVYYEAFFWLRGVGVGEARSTLVLPSGARGGLASAYAFSYTCTITVTACGKNSRHDVQ